MCPRGQIKWWKHCFWKLTAQYRDPCSCPDEVCVNDQEIKALGYNSVSGECRKETWLSGVASKLCPRPDDAELPRQETCKNQFKGHFSYYSNQVSYLSQSESQEVLSSKLLTQSQLQRWMASATVYLVLPRAHFSIFAMQRFDWRNRWSRLSDNNKGSWRTLEGKSHQNENLIKKAFKMPQNGNTLNWTALLQHLTLLKTPAGLSSSGWRAPYSSH